MISETTPRPRTVHQREGDLTLEDVDHLRSQFITAWDIETSGLDFTTDKIGTVQIADEAGDLWLLHVTPELRPDALVYLLSENSARKLFHFAPFDLAFMRFAWGARAQNVACTKVLDRLVHPEADSHSLKDVLHRELGIDLEKDERVRQSDWTTSTLTEEQVEYALGDVAHLIPLFDRLLDKATQKGVSRLAENSFAYLPTRVETEILGLKDVFAY